MKKIHYIFFIFMIFFMFSFFKIRVDDNILNYMNAKDPVMIIFNSMNNDFENSGNIIISVRSEDYTADISKIDLLTKNLENKDFIKSVQSVSNISVSYNKNNILYTGDIFSVSEKSGEPVENIIDSNPEIFGNFFSDNNKYMLLNLYIYDNQN
ncbi:MAG TPA: hypothetical protein PLS66_11850, partial [Tepiditoga sp.]|nr:hypothetical protein [Tepiditoga sp.]